MRKLSLLPTSALLALLLAACSEATTGNQPKVSPSADADQRRVGVYGALIPELVRSEGMSWERVYVVTTLCTNPAAPVKKDDEECDKALSEAEQEALRTRLGIEHLRFIDDPSSLYDDKWFTGQSGRLVVTLGPIVETGGGVRVGASYGCGGLCGAGNTWTLHEQQGEWVVVGTQGPGWIA